jgi:hypothetical protein
MRTVPACKANDASFVRIMMSRRVMVNADRSRSEQALLLVVTYRYRHKDLDNGLPDGVILFTLLEPLRPSHIDGRQNTRNQAESSPTSRHAQSSARRDHSPIVPNKRFLRSRRYDPGQVRDAAPSACRAAAGHSVGKGIWFLTPLFLSGTTGIRAERSVGIDTAETWASQRTQANHRCHGVSQQSSSQRFITTDRGFGADGERRVRCGGAPPQHRTSTLTAKKTPMSPIPSAMCGNNELVGQYEELRRQVLDRSLGIHRGPGLALLIQRGMRAWMDVSSICSNTPSSTTLRPSNREDVLASDQRGEIVMVLAAMALHRYQEANG